MRAENHAPRGVPSAARSVLDVGAVRRAVISPGGLWQSVEVTPVTGSTNADLLALAAGGAGEGTVLAAEEQVAGRGRLGRAWVSPPRAALTFSLLLRPQAIPPARRGWISLLAGVAVASAVRAVAPVDARLKWPNDILAGPAKLGGILAEAAGDAVVVGIGLNVSTEPAELPPPGPGALPATSLRILLASGSGPDPAREALLIEILAAAERWYQAWRRAGGDPESCGLRAEYTRLCGTIGRRVRVELPGGQLFSGLAVGVDPDGRLLVRESPRPGSSGAGSERAVAAGDVVHLR
jgi:BirA family transcriptional regulator, biotin operon repressor / biotin---[acetyl-CoA-carboxylase] ligase